MSAKYDKMAVDGKKFAHSWSINKFMSDFFSTFVPSIY
jgi:hypothetical protein